MKKYMIVLMILGLIGAANVLFPAQSTALDSYWIGGESGWWDDPANWSPYGVPENPEFDFNHAYVTQSDDNDRTALYRNSNSENGSRFLLTIGSTGSGTMTFSQSQDSLTARSIQINGNVVYNMDGGLLGVAESSGSLTIDGGTFNQNGGVVARAMSERSDFLLNSGTYNLKDGRFYAQHEYISAPFTFNQSGGTNSSSYFHNSGTYNLSGGTLSGGYPNFNFGTFNQTAGSAHFDLDNHGIYNLSGGDLWGHIANFGTLNYSGGSLSNLFNYSITSLSGGGTRTIVGGVSNYYGGTFKTTHTTAVYTETFTNNGAYISDPATQYFNNLIVGQTGYLVGQHADKFYISGDFLNNSIMNMDWNTMQAYLGFTEGTDNLHDFYITGHDYGATMSGYADNFSWGTLDLTQQNLRLLDGNLEEGGALYLRELWGADIEGLIIANLCGFDGLDIYYMSNFKGNDYLGGLTYALTGGGYLKPIPTPEPATMLLLASGLVGLAGLRRKFKK